MRLIWKILREHIRPAQWVGFVLANIVGLSIVLCGLQLYLDISPLLNPGTGFMKPDYLVVTKPVSTLTTLSMDKPVFTEAEIGDIASQPFVEQCGAFTAARYQISGQLKVAKLDVQLTTDLFFESVPEDFVDVASEEWHFSPGETVVPIIIPQDYLNLYNFGFASSANMPAVSESLIRRVRFDLYLYGNGQRERMTGRVVGFSTRLNTILVPESFIRWSNERFAPQESADAPSRLIVRVNNPSDRAITTYFDEHGYHIDQDKLDSSKAGWLLRILVVIVMCIGGLICLLSCYVLILSVFLLLQKNRQSVRDLLLLGYPVRRVALPYQALVTMLVVLSLCVSLAIMAVARSIYVGYLRMLVPDYMLSSALPTVLVAVGLVLLIIFVNLILIHRHVKGVEQ